MLLERGNDPASAPTPSDLPVDAVGGKRCDPERSIPLLAIGTEPMQKRWEKAPEDIFVDGCDRSH